MKFFEERIAALPAPELHLLAAIVLREEMDTAGKEIKIWLEAIQNRLHEP
jgi:hypothetical protein